MSTMKFKNPETGEWEKVSLPNSHVKTFNGRNGNVVPEAGDYTAEMVGARADDWMPSAEEVGAVNKAGDTMTGDLTLASKSLKITNHDNTIDVFEYDNTAYLRHTNSDNVRRALMLQHGSKAISDALILETNASGSSKSYKIYGEHNKPTPADIGAATSGHTHYYAGSSSVGGAAASAEKLASQAHLTTETDMDNFLTSARVQYATFKLAEDTRGLGFGADDGMLLSIPWSNENYGFQMAFDDLNGAIAVRNKSGIWYDWQRVLTTANYKTYVAPAYTYGTTDLTAGSSSLETGKLYFVYE